jgi:hypothetical protein
MALIKMRAPIQPNASPALVRQKVAELVRQRIEAIASHADFKVMKDESGKDHIVVQLPIDYHLPERKRLRRVA